MRSSWNRFLPGHTNSNHSLISLLLFHSSDEVRGMVCRVLIAFFTDSKQYLSIACNKVSKNSSFTSLSQQLANQLLIVFNVAAKIIQGQENSVIPDLYRLLRVLFQNSVLKNLVPFSTILTYSLENFPKCY